MNSVEIRNAGQLFKKLTDEQQKWIVKRMKNYLYAKDILAPLKGEAVKVYGELERTVLVGLPQPTQQEKEDTMCYETNKTLDQTQLSYFKDRLASVRYEKDEALLRQFGMSADPTPATPEELIERIEAGKFVLRDSKYGFNLLDRFSWRDPSVKKDQLGYDAASAALQAEYITLKDAIVTAPADGAKQVAALQAWTYTAPATA